MTFDDLVRAYTHGLGLGDSSNLSPVPAHLTRQADNRAYVISAVKNFFDYLGYGLNVFYKKYFEVMVEEFYLGKREL